MSYCEPKLARAPWALTLVLALAGGCHLKTEAERVAEPIIEKNVAARGGLEAWRAIHAISMSGHLDAGRPRNQLELANRYLKARTQGRPGARKAVEHASELPKPISLPFVMELARPRKTRLELRFEGQTAIQVFDGAHGWKVRPFLGRHEVEPFAPEEQRIAEQQAELDGPLIDSEAKGNRVALVKTEPVDGRDAYELEVTSPDHHIRHVWIDTQTYLDVKTDGIRRLDGKDHAVFTLLKDYRAEGAVMVPHRLETFVDGVPGVEAIVIEHVTLNPELAPARFEKPE